MADIRTNSFWTNLLQKILKIILKNLGVRTSKPTHNQHVVPHDEGWAVKGAGNERYTGVYTYQRDAIDPQLRLHRYHSRRGWSGSGQHQLSRKVIRTPIQ